MVFRTAASSLLELLLVFIISWLTAGLPSNVKTVRLDRDLKYVI